MIIKCKANSLHLTNLGHTKDRTHYTSLEFSATKSIFFVIHFYLKWWTSKMTNYYILIFNANQFPRLPKWAVTYAQLIITFLSAQSALKAISSIKQEHTRSWNWWKQFSPNFSERSLARSLARMCVRACTLSADMCVRRAAANGTYAECVNGIVSRGVLPAAEWLLAYVYFMSLCVSDIPYAKERVGAELRARSHAEATRIWALITCCAARLVCN
jgi:hypothetical protein